MSNLTCSECGSTVPIDSSSCPECGTLIKDHRAAPERRSTKTNDTSIIPLEWATILGVILVIGSFLMFEYGRLLLSIWWMVLLGLSMFIIGTLLLWRAVIKRSKHTKDFYKRFGLGDLVGDQTEK